MGSVCEKKKTYNWWPQVVKSECKPTVNQSIAFWEDKTDLCPECNIPTMPCYMRKSRYCPYCKKVCFDF